MGAITFTTEGSPATMMELRYAAIMTALADRVSLLMLKLQAHIVTEHLSGRPPGLNQISGRLAGSIRAIPSEIQGEQIVGSVEGAGGPAWYGAVHEFGGTRAYQILPVNAKALRFEVGGRVVFAKSVNHPPLPERSFMRSSLVEMRDEIVASLQQAASEAGSA